MTHTSLYRRMTQADALSAAWNRVRQGGKAPGMDGVSIEQFDFHSDRELARLRRELLEDTYRPWPARRIHLTKADRGLRRIGVQTVRDRVAQRALLQLLQPRIEPTLEPCAFAYRPGRSIEMALSRLAQWHEAGYDWAAGSDVALCFDSLDRKMLQTRLSETLPESDMRGLIHDWLTAGVVDETGWHEPGVGVVQGDVLSPLLCNLYLDRFDERMNLPAHPLIRYADDFVLLARSETAAWRALKEAEEALKEIGLRLNPGKTRVASFVGGFEYLGAGIAGSLILPLNRVERPGRAPRFTFGYERTDRRRIRVIASSDETAGIPYAATQKALRDHLLSALRSERAGHAVPSMASALLEAWKDSGRIEEPRRISEPEGWQSLYLI